MTKENDKVSTKQRQEYLRCLLTTDEVALAANELAKQLDDLAIITAELTTVKAEFKAKAEKCKAEITIQQRLVRDKREHRNVDCDVIYNFTQLTVTVTRKDTGEVVENRKMSSSEKQMKLNFDE